VNRGRVVFSHAELDDWILVRTDGTPTYNFCVVVDDVTMKITHVIRGNDHLSNTPKQVLCYQALGYPLPVFAHIPMILAADKTRLSKRHGATSVLASVLAVVIAMAVGISASFWTGVASYVVALASFAIAAGQLRKKIEASAARPTTS